MAKTYNLLFEVIPLNGTTPTTLRLTNLSADKNATTANGQSWLPCITSMPDVGLTLSADGLLDDLKIERGELSFFCSDDFTNHIWSSYVWNNAFYRAWYGENGTDFASYTLFGEGRTTNLERDGNQVTVRLLGPEADVTSKLLSNSYAGIGGAEGPLGFKGNLKPRCFGAPLSVEPVELDPVNLVYQVHGYGAVASIQPYEYGLPLEASQNKGNAASYAALIALPLVPGEYATCLAEGMFRFGGTPTPKITADVTMSGGTTLADIATAILTAAGVPSNKIGSFAAVSSVHTNLYVTSQVEALEALQSLFKQAGCYLFADKSGTWHCGRFYASTKSAITLNSDRSTFPILLDWKEEPTKPPIKKVSYGFQHCWGVHSDSEASPIINELAQKAEENGYWENIKGDGKPEDNATVGAPEGTLVGDKPAEQVIDAISAEDGELIKSRQLQADIDAAAQVAQELQNTYGSTASAAASASAAAQHDQNAAAAATNAQTARDQAEGAFDAADAAKAAALGSANLASSKADAASGSAAAAAGSANTASTKAGEAGQSASSASASANTATAKANEAQGSANAASSSASSASSKASEAAQSASAAQQSQVSADLAVQSLLPSDFNSLKNWSGDWGTATGDWTGDGRVWTYDHGQLGRIVEINNNPTFSPHFVPKGRLTLVRNKVYRITVTWLLVGAQTGPQVGAWIFAIGIKPNSAQTGNYFNDINSGVTISEGQAGWGTGSFATHSIDVHSNTLMDAGCQWTRPLFRLDSQGAFVLKAIEIRDITGEYNAYNSASAAAGSASTAAAAKDQADQYASAANSSQTQAATSASNAKGSEDAAWQHRVGASGHESAAWTYRNEASNSASNAAGSASTASQQAGLASNSANSAGQSASAAAGSASTATTKASEASQSASAASSSQVTASNAATGAQQQFAKSFPNFVGPIGKNAYDYAGDNGNGFSWENGPDSGWPQPYITAQGPGQGGRYNRITFKESMEKVVGRRYRVTGWFYNHGNNCEFVDMWVLGTDNNQWDGNAVGYAPDAVAPDCVNSQALNQGGFWKVGIEFTVQPHWKSKWKPIFQFVTTGAAPNGLWHMTGMTITDITSEKAAADSASAASSSYSNAQYQAGQASQSAQAASGSANTASIKAGEASGSASAAAGSAATANERASAASSSATLAATFSTGGGNLIPESTFAVGTSGWNSYAPDANNLAWSRDLAGDDWRPTNEHNIGIRQDDSNQGRWSQWHADQISIRGGTWYEFSGYVAAHRCNAFMRIDWLDANGNGIKSDYNFNTNTGDANGGRNINNWKICWGKYKSPDNAARAYLVFVKDPTWAGQGDSYAWTCRPMVRQTYEQANGPSPYSAGSGALTAASQSASITQNQQAIATTNSSLASLTTIVQAGSPNLIRNGGFAMGMQYWGQTHGGWSTGRSGWGQVANRGGDWSGNHTYIETEKMPIFGEAIYTLSADSVYFLHWGDGHCYTEIVWFDGAGNYITQNSGNPHYANHDFSNTDVNRNIHRLQATAPGNATQCVVRLVHYKGNASPNVIGWRQVKLEQGDRMTPYSAEASVTTINEAVTSVDGKANQALARAGVRLDVNGYQTGWEIANNGSSGNMVINADYFAVKKPGGGARTEYSNGRWMATDGSSYMSVWGAPFGQGNRFLRWSGPYSGDLNSCHEGNAKEYLRVDGSMYFGGSLLAGSLRNSQGSSSTASNASTQIGPFSSNGGTITVNASWTYSFWTRQDYEASQTGVNAHNADISNFGTQFLQDTGSGHSGSKSIGLSVSNLVLNLRRNGGLVASQAGGNGILSLEGYKPTPGDAWGWIKWTYSYSASFTYTDPDHNTSQRTYTADIARSGLGAGNDTDQRVFVTSVEG